MPKIVAVRACAVSVPLDAPLASATRTAAERQYGLVEVEAEDGIAGVGFSHVGNRGGRLFVEAVHGLLAPLLVGEDAHRVEGLWEAMYRESLPLGRAGVVMRALSALDIALWDRNARAANLPLYRFLGAAKAGRVPAYVGGGYYRPGKTAKMLADECAGYVAQGFKAVKIKVGALADLGEEQARVAAVRKRIGPGVKLMLDANQAWSDLPTALGFVEAFARFDPFWIEEPFGPDDLDNHARLAAAVGVPIATGEMESGRWRFREIVEAEAASILQPSATVVGGITEFRRVAALAAGFGLRVWPHWFHDLHVHLVAATPNAGMVEFFPDDQVLNFRRMIDAQLVAEAGELVLPERPGLGFDFSPDAVKRYAIERWRVTGTISVPPPPAPPVRTRARAARRIGALRRGRR